MRSEAPEQAVADTTSQEIKALLVSATGNVRLAGDGAQVLEKARHRMAQHGLTSLGAYLDLLKQGEIGRDELDCLIAELTVGETYFFRHPEQFDVLRDHVLPACIERNRDTRQIRIWSAGCSNGAEAYSIATVVHAVLGHRYDDWHVTIVGSDINRAFLADAEGGAFSTWHLRGLQKEQISGYFGRNGNAWQIRDKYRKNVRFVYHNMVNEDIPSIDRNIFAFDIIFCRNVMIYFDDTINDRLVKGIDGALVSGGWLFIAPADFNEHVDAAFIAERQAESFIYRKRPPIASVTTMPLAETPTTPVATTRTAAPTPLPHPVEPISLPRVTAALQAAIRARGPLARRRDAATGTPPPALAQERAQERAPASIDTIVALANRADWQEAEEHCRTVLAADPFNVAAHYYLALILDSTGDMAGAEQALKRAVYLDRDFALAHYQLGIVRKNGQRTAAIRSFHHALEALAQRADDEVISPCGTITAHELRTLTNQQIEHLEA